MKIWIAGLLLIEHFHMVLLQVIYLNLSSTIN